MAIWKIAPHRDLENRATLRDLANRVTRIILLWFDFGNHSEL